jgi:hypothetical protein
MRSFPVRSICSLVLASLAISQRSLARAEELELECGRTAAGQIKVILDFSQPILLPVSIYPGVPGYARADVGVHSTILDEPEEDFFQFSPDANFELILLAKSRGMELWNDHGSGFLPVGGKFFVGPSPFDTHPLWNIPNIRQIGSLALSLKLHDMNGIYSDSDPITLSFKPASNSKGLAAQDDPMLPTARTVPEPAQPLLPLSAIALQMLRRRNNEG